MNSDVPVPSDSHHEQEMTIETNEDVNLVSTKEDIINSQTSQIGENKPDQSESTNPENLKKVDISNEPEISSEKDHYSASKDQLYSMSLESTIINKSEQLKEEVNKAYDEEQEDFIETSQDGNSQINNNNEEDEESEYETDLESSEEEEEEDPPLLKYTRLSQLPKSFFNKELITTTLIHETFYAFGTSSGILYITDPNFTHLGTIRARKSPILSINTDGTHIVAVSMDGTVAITLLNNISNATNTTAYDLKVPLFSLVFKGQYKDTKSFIYATKAGTIVLSTLNWLGNRQERTLWKSPSDSSVVKLDIVKNVLVWLSDDGIGFMDLKTEKILKIIKRPKGSPRAELILPKLNFIEHDRIIIGWVNYIWSIKIEENINNHENIVDELNNGFKFSSAMSSFSRNTQDISITIEYHFKIEDEALIGGIGSFKDDSILILVLKEINGKLVEPPELRIVNYFNKEEISSDEIILKDYDLLKCNDFSLIQSNYSKIFLLASTDGIIADEYTLRDRFDWYFNNGKILKAYDISKFLISKRERASLGIKQVEAYINENTSHNWENASKFLSKVIDDSFDLESNDVYIDLWDQWTWIYIKNKKHLLLADILPRDKSKNVVNKSIYDCVLTEFIENKDQLNFHKYLQIWDLNFFHVEQILRKLETILEFEPDLNIFQRCLAESYLKLNQPKNAIRHLIFLQDPIVLELLRKYHLISFFVQDIPTIIKFQISDEELMSLTVSTVSDKVQNIIDLLVLNRHEVPPQTVLDVTNSPIMEKFKLIYLQSLLTKDPELTQPFETTIFHLYVKHNPTKLLSFLKNQRHYNIEQAISTLETNKQYTELVYLLGKIGQTRQAMSLLIKEMDDPIQALDFARGQNTKEIWDIFIESGITKPNFIKVIIQYTGILFDTSILKRIPEGVEIEGLQVSLVRIMVENSCDLTIQQTVLKILEIEGIKYCDLMNQLRLKGRVVNENLDFLKLYECISIDDKGCVKGIGERLA